MREVKPNLKAYDRLWKVCFASAIGAVCLQNGLLAAGAIVKNQAESKKVDIETACGYDQFNEAYKKDNGTDYDRKQFVVEFGSAEEHEMYVKAEKKEKIGDKLLYSAIAGTAVALVACAGGYVAISKTPDDEETKSL